MLRSIPFLMLCLITGFAVGSYAQATTNENRQAKVIPKLAPATNRPAMRYITNAVARTPSGPVQVIEARQNALRERIKTIETQSAAISSEKGWAIEAAATGTQREAIKRSEVQRRNVVTAQIAELNRQIAALEVQRLQYVRIYGARTNHLAKP